jgi:hypothetical protein
MRFHVPNVKKDKDEQKANTSGTITKEEVSQAEQMLEQILSKADVISATGKGILTFEAMPVLTPRFFSFSFSHSFTLSHSHTLTFPLSLSPTFLLI